MADAVMTHSGKQTPALKEGKSHKPEEYIRYASRN